jgi:TPR repeat protein
LKKNSKIQIILEMETNNTLNIINNNICNHQDNWKHLVEEKDVPLSIQYFLGLFRQADHQKAFELFKNTNNLDESHAMTELAEMYQYNYHDYKKAFELYECAIRLGNTKAMHDLAYMYIDGFYVDVDYKKAIELFESAIKLGNTNSMNAMAYMYINGEQVKVDYIKAYELFETALKLGNFHGKINLTEFYKNHANDLDLDCIVKYMKLMDSGILDDNGITIPKKFINRLSQTIDLENKIKDLENKIEELEYNPYPGSKFLETQQRFIEMSNN